MHGSFHRFHPAGVSNGALAPVRPRLRSLKSKPKVKSARSTHPGRGRFKVGSSAGADRRPPFARNEPKLNRESPEAGGTQKFATFALDEPAWVSCADFFPAAKDFEHSKEIKNRKKLVVSTRPARRLALIRPFISWPPGGRSKVVRIKTETGGQSTRTWSQVCEIFFSFPASAKNAAKFGGGGSRQP